MSQLESVEPGIDRTGYIQRLDLGDDPFSSEFESDYFYRGAMRQQILDQVVHFSRFTDQVVVLTGSTGSGTSRVLDEMLAQLHQIMDCCDIDGDEEPTPELIIASLARQLQFQQIPENLIEFLKILDEYSYIGEESEPLLVAVDQAHYLSIESFELLLSIISRANGSIRLLLVGEYQTEQLAKLAGFSHDQMQILELEPLTVDEAGQYVLGLLCSVGYAGDQPLSSDQLAILHEQSGGNLSEINNLAAELLAIDSRIDKTGFKLNLPIAHISAIFILVSSLGYAYWYMGVGEMSENDTESYQKDIADVTTKEIPKLKTTDDLLIASAGKDESIGALGTNDDVKITSSDEHEEEVSETNSNALQPAGNTQSPAESMTTSENRAKEIETAGLDSSRLKNMVNKVDSDQVETVPKILAKNSSDSDSGSDSGSKTTSKSVSPEKEEIPIDMVSTEVAKKIPTKLVEIVESETLTISPIVKPIVKPVVKPVVKSAVKPIVNSANRSSRDQSLLGLPSDTYMLQLAGNSSEGRIKDFVKKFAGRITITYIETKRKNKPWYIALSGPYNTLNDAKKAIPKLPEVLQKQKPWIKSVASIQSEIKKLR